MVDKAEEAKYKKNRIFAQRYSRSRLTKARRVPSGTLLEFQYGAKKPVNEAGGWHGDPRPVLLVFFDDKSEFIEGINVNYLANAEYMRLLAAIDKMELPEDSMQAGKMLYEFVKSIAPGALNGYRKYKRNKIRSMFRVNVDPNDL